MPCVCAVCACVTELWGGLLTWHDDATGEDDQGCGAERQTSLGTALLLMGRARGRRRAWAGGRGGCGCVDVPRGVAGALVCPAGASFEPALISRVDSPENAARFGLPGTPSDHRRQSAPIMHGCYVEHGVGRAWGGVELERVECKLFKCIMVQNTEMSPPYHALLAAIGRVHRRDIPQPQPLRVRVRAAPTV